MLLLGTHQALLVLLLRVPEHPLELFSQGLPHVSTPQGLPHPGSGWRCWEEPARAVAPSDRARRAPALCGPATGIDSLRVAIIPKGTIQTLGNSFQEGNNTDPSDPYDFQRGIPKKGPHEFRVGAPWILESGPQIHRNP